jgi:hypothetical protein
MTPQERKLDALWEKHISEWFGLCAALGCLAAVLLLAAQSIRWLKTGHWTPLPVSAGFEFAGINPDLLAATSWEGINRVVTWLLDVHLGFLFVFAGAVVGGIFGRIAYEISAARSKAAP